MQANIHTAWNQFPVKAHLQMREVFAVRNSLTDSSKGTQTVDTSINTKHKNVQKSPRGKKLKYIFPLTY